MRYILFFILLFTQGVKAQDDVNDNVSDYFKSTLPSVFMSSLPEEEPEVIHLDIPWRCKWCGIEVIVDPYTTSTSSCDDEDCYSEEEGSHW